MAIEMDAESLWSLLSLAFDEGVAGADAGRVAFPPDVAGGEPDARTRQVLQVSAENDRLRSQVAAASGNVRIVQDELARLYAAIRAVRDGGFPASYPPISRLYDLLPPEQRDRGDEADCVRDERVTYGQ